MEMRGGTKRKKDGNSNEIAIRCRNVRETKKPERFSRADACNKLNSVLFSCIFTLLAPKKKTNTYSCFNEKKRKKKRSIENVTKGKNRPAVF